MVQKAKQAKNMKSIKLGGKGREQGCFRLKTTAIILWK